MQAGSTYWVTVRAWLQVTVMATLGSCKAVASTDVVAHASKAQQLGAFTMSWISHVDWPPSVAPAAPFRQG